MGPSDGTTLKQALAFKYYEIEELADRFFFRPAGALIAHAANPTPLSPNQLTVIGALLGAGSGALLYRPELGLWAFAGLVLHSIVDSADGQLARLRRSFSAEGRVLDGLGGYATFTSIFIAIAAGHAARTGDWGILLPMFLAGLSCAAHAGSYDYHRGQYQTYGLKGELPKVEKLDTSTTFGRLLSLAYGDYEANQRRLHGAHALVEDELRRRFGGDGRLSPEASEAYRRRYYWMVRGWNFLGDNTRFYTIGLVGWLQSPESFLWINLTVMNAAMAALWLVQRRVDRAYLADLAAFPDRDPRAVPPSPLVGVQTPPARGGGR